MEIKSNEDEVATTAKFVWFQAKVENTIFHDHISTAIPVPNYSLWLAFCNSPGELFFAPPPTGKEIIWTIFKTSEKMVVECNGVFCAEFTYSDSTKGDTRCKAYTLPTRKFYFVDDNTQVATHYRLTGTRQT